MLQWCFFFLALQQEFDTHDMQQSFFFSVFGLPRLHQMGVLQILLLVF